jgi:hypothetical protein
MPMPSTRRQRLAQRLCFLLPCWHCVWPRLASSSLASHCVGTMCWHAHARHVATTSHPLSSSPPRQRPTDKHHPRRLHARLLPLRRRCCALLHARALSSLCCRAEPSPPSLPPCAGPRCPHAMRGYKRRPLPFVRLSVPPPLPPSGKPPRSCLASVFCHFIGNKPPHPTSLLVRRSQSFIKAQSCSPTRRTGTFTAVELRRRRPRR